MESKNDVPVVKDKPFPKVPPFRDEKFSDIDEEIADLKKSVKCLQTKMDAADNDLGITSTNINDLFRSVYRNHESIMEEINIINEKIKFMNNGSEMVTRYMNEKKDYENKIRLIKMENEWLTSKNNKLVLENEQLSLRIKRAERKRCSS